MSEWPTREKRLETWATGFQNSMDFVSEGLPAPLTPGEFMQVLEEFRAERTRRESAEGALAQILDLLGVALREGAHDAADSANKYDVLDAVRVAEGVLYPKSPSPATEETEEKR